MGKDQERQTYSAFISYASQDKEKAETICESLENRGFSCWIAPRQVRPGREYGEEIIRGIESSRCLVLVLSEAANESTFVRRELERAVSKRKPIFPVRIEEVMPSSALELFISTTHWIDAWNGPLAAHAERLAEELGEAPSSSAAGGRQLTTPRAQTRQHPKWVTYAAGVMVIAVVVALVNALTSRNRNGTGVVDDPQGSRGEVPSPSATEVLMQQVAEAGVPVESITPADLTVIPEPGVGGTISVGISLSEKLTKLQPFISELQLAIGDGAFRSVGSGASRRISHGSIDQRLLAQHQSIRIRLDLLNGASIGPFTYPVDPEKAAAMKIKADIASREQWFRPVFNQPVISFSPLVGSLEQIRSIRIGSQADKLERRIDVLPEEVSRSDDPNAIYIKQSNSDRPVPIRPGLAELHVELEFTDGTRSEVRQFALPPSPWLSQELIPENAGDGNPPPQVFAMLAEDPNDRSRELFALLPLAPSGTQKILYSFDGGSLNPYSAFYRGSRTIGDTSLAQRFAKSSTLQFLFQMADGSEIGPHSYKIGEISALLLPGYKKQLLSNRREMVAALRIRNREALIPRAASAGGRPADDVPPDLTSTPQRRSLQSHLTNNYFRITEEKQGMLKALPGVLLFPTEPTEYSPRYRHWAAVKEIRYGIDPENLDKRTEIHLTPDQAMTGEGLDRGFVWFATLPVDSESISCQFVFRDGEESAPMTVPIEDF